MLEVYAHLSQWLGKYVEGEGQFLSQYRKGSASFRCLTCMPDASAFILITYVMQPPAWKMLL